MALGEVSSGAPVTGRLQHTPQQEAFQRPAGGRGLRWGRSVVSGWTDRSSCLVSEWGPPTLGALRPGVRVWVLTMSSPGLFYHADMT